MVIRKSDLTQYAIELGLWGALLDEAGIGRESQDSDDVEIEILKAKKV